MLGLNLGRILDLPDVWREAAVNFKRDGSAPHDPAFPWAAQVMVERVHDPAYEPGAMACTGGRGRTGTALACLAIIDGLPPEQAVAFVRQHYDPHAVETPWQKRYAARFATPRKSG